MYVVCIFLFIDCVPIVKFVQCQICPFSRVCFLLLSVSWVFVFCEYGIFINPTVLRKAKIVCNRVNTTKAG